MVIQNFPLRSRKKPSAAWASRKVTVMELAVISVTVTSLEGSVGVQEGGPSARSASAAAMGQRHTDRRGTALATRWGRWAWVAACRPPPTPPPTPDRLLSLQPGQGLVQGWTHRKTSLHVPSLAGHELIPSGTTERALGLVPGALRAMWPQERPGPLWALDQLDLMPQGALPALRVPGSEPRGWAALPSSSGGCSAGSHSLAACRTSGAGDSCRKSSRRWL